MKILSMLSGAALLCLSLAAQSQAVRPHELEDFVRREKFDDIKISPTGEYYAATVPIERKTALVVLRRADNKLMTSVSIPGDRTHVSDFWWANADRVLISAAEKFGDLEAPQLTGDLYAVDADGGKGELLVGPSLLAETTGTRLQPKKTEQVAAFPIDTLKNDDKFVVVSIVPFSSDPYTRVERLNIYTGERSPITRAPVRNARFVTDDSGEVRFAIGMTTDRVSRLYYRKGKGEDWTLLNDSSESGRVEVPLGFSADGRTAYLQVEHDSGPDAVIAFDTVGGERREIVRDDDTSPTRTIMGRNAQPIGVVLDDGLPRREFFDPQDPDAKLYRKLERAFEGESVEITSITSDGRLALVLTTADRNPGDFFVFDTTTNKAERILSRRDWIDPARAAVSKPIRYKARDGLEIHGYLTAPVGGEAKNAPMIVLIHGGPYSVHDAWGFDTDAQILAAHGYAVLQVNFRGSDNRGKAFERAGRRQWGGAMQDDITDATRWAIEQGIADPNRICLFGASYGGYASLMGVAREPTLYRCAAGHIGVYDLPTMHTHGDIREAASGESFILDWIGPREEVAALSPTRLADRIKVPVFLSAGGEDRRAPVQHTEMMEKALRKAGATVEAHYYPTEGHGFYKPENQRDFYARLLGFFQRHLGGRAPVVVASPAKR